LTITAIGTADARRRLDGARPTECLACPEAAD
jgi:hypothetical protein